MEIASSSRRGNMQMQDLISAAKDQRPVMGLTHNFYRYPARFSPAFVSNVIQQFSNPGDLILDPYMGGGTTVVEAIAAGRRVVGSDINSLSVFVAKVKSTVLSARDERLLIEWILGAIRGLRVYHTSSDVDELIKDHRTRNLDLPNARYLKKPIALAIATTEQLPTPKLRRYARCAILRAAQIALDGRTRRTSVAEIRLLVEKKLYEMLDGSASLRKANPNQATLLQRCASELPQSQFFAKGDRFADLVITSPPYPGVHVLYHRWQIDGRRESPAPYWIAGCNDGLGSSHYTFGDRHETNLYSFFETSLRTLTAIRSVMRYSALFVQMIAFNNPKAHLRRYLKNMEAAGFVEDSPLGKTTDGKVKRIWRNVPGRRWHAKLRGATSSSREVVLIHRAI